MNLPSASTRWQGWKSMATHCWIDLSSCTDQLDCFYIDCSAFNYNKWFRHNTISPLWKNTFPTSKSRRNSTFSTPKTKDWRACTKNRKYTSRTTFEKYRNCTTRTTNSYQITSVFLSRTRRLLRNTRRATGSCSSSPTSMHRSTTFSLLIASVTSGISLFRKLNSITVSI